MILVYDNEVKAPVDVPLINPALAFAGLIRGFENLPTWELRLCTVPRRLADSRLRGYKPVKSRHVQIRQSGYPPRSLLLQ
jgi:hypothetical protein